MRLLDEDVAPFDMQCDLRLLAPLLFSQFLDRQ
jgi:hypothetical protein